MDTAGLYYFRARYYSSALQRFISQDPIGFAGGANLYAYAGNNPVSLIDPLGTKPGCGGSLFACGLDQDIQNLFNAVDNLLRRLAQAYQTLPMLAGAGLGAGGEMGLATAADGVTVSKEGLAAVTNHLAQFGDHPPNQAMIDRLADQLGLQVTGADENFYTHELLEADYMAQGMTYEEAHAAALEQAGVSPFSLYNPEVIQMYPEYFNNAWREFWGIL